MESAAQPTLLIVVTGVEPQYCIEFWNPANPANVRSVNEQQIQLAAQVLGVTLLPVEIRRADAFEQAFATIAKARPDALFVMADRFLLAHRAGIVDFAATHRLPAMCPYKEYVEAGCLMSGAE